MPYIFLVIYEFYPWPTRIHLPSTSDGGTLWYNFPEKATTPPTTGSILSPDIIRGEEPSGILIP